MKDKIKIAFFDVDGTLFNHWTNEISQLTIDALKQLKANGVMICIATGRPIEMMKQIMECVEDVGFEYLITSNGQTIHHKKELIYKNFLHPDDVKAIVKRANELDLAISLVGDDFNIINRKREIVDISCDSVGFPRPTLMDIPNDFNKPVDQLVCYEPITNMKYFQSVIKHSVMTHWSIEAFDFVPNNGVKVNGIKKILKHLNIPAEQAIAFGDGQNDIDMLSYVGFGVAMGNSLLDVQEAADYVCEHINDEGVYHTLKKTNLI